MLSTRKVTSSTVKLLSLGTPVGVQSSTSAASVTAGAVLVVPPVGSTSVTAGGVPSAMKAARYQSVTCVGTLLAASVGRV